MKFHISTDGEGANGSFDPQHHFARGILDHVARLEDGPFLFYGANDGPRGRGHLHTLQPTRAPAGVTSQRTI